MSDPERRAKRHRAGDRVYYRKSSVLLPVSAPEDGDTIPKLEETSSTPPPNFTPPTPSTSTPGHPGANLPPEFAALHSRINTLQAGLENITTVITQLAASVARLQPEQAAPTSSTTTAPFPCSHPGHPRTIASGRGAASPEIFQEMVTTNWHGRLGRTHMVDVDALPTTALAELDCFLRRKLHEIYPRGGNKTWPNADAIFASLASLGLRLEDRGAYADLPMIQDMETLRNTPTIKRGRNAAAWYTTKEKYADYWHGVLLETLVELARYRGLFDDEGYLKEN